MLITSVTQLRSTSASRSHGVFSLRSADHVAVRSSMAGPDINAVLANVRNHCSHLIAPISVLCLLASCRRGLPELPDDLVQRLSLGTVLRSALRACIAVSAGPVYTRSPSLIDAPVPLRASTKETAAVSFIEPVGFRYSSLTQASAPLAGTHRRNPTRGVLPHGAADRSTSPSYLDAAARDFG